MPTPYLASFEGQGDENTREQLALEIYIQASLGEGMTSAKRWSARIGRAVSANPDYTDKRRLDNGNRRGDCGGYRCQPFSVHALGRGYSLSRS